MSILQGANNITITGGNFVAGDIRGSRALKYLKEAAAHSALHDSAARFDAPRCHQNTRVNYRHQLGRWTLGYGEYFAGKRLIWLHGGAGVGKSAIMQSVVEDCTQHNIILGTFFFSRSDSTRNSVEVLIPTLAYQLARAFPAAAAILETVIDHDPLILTASLRTHAYELLVRPILHLIDTGIIENTAVPRRVFVIDGLDECTDPQKQALLINVIASILCEYHVPVHFLIASRPEIAISYAFQMETPLHGLFGTISLDDNADARADIRQFIEDSFHDIVDSHPMRNHIVLPWPTAHSISKLVGKSSGHFIYAATVMRFIASSDDHPVRALQVIEGLMASRTRSPFVELDALYRHILTSARYAKHVLAILRQGFLTELDTSTAYRSAFSWSSHSIGTASFSMSVVSLVQGISPADVELFLSDVRALVSVSLDRESRTLAICPKHLSLQDFLKDEARSQTLYMAPETYHATLLSRFFYLLGTNWRGLGLRFDFSIEYLTRVQKKIPTQGGNTLILAICKAIEYSHDTELVNTLVKQHSPKDIWLFHQTSPSHNPRKKDWTSTLRSFSVAKYMTSIRDCVCSEILSIDDNAYVDDVSVIYGDWCFQISNKDNALYLHQFPMYMQFLLDNLNRNSDDALELRQNPRKIGLLPRTEFSNRPSVAENRIIPALLFSATPSTLQFIHHLIFNFYAELGINQWHACYLVHLVDPTSTSGVYSRSIEALSHLPESNIFWGSDLAKAMELILKPLLRQSWKPPFYFSNQHKQWLGKAKPSKHVSMGFPQISSWFYDHDQSRGWSKPVTKYNYDLPYHFNFLTVETLVSSKSLWRKKARSMCAEGYDCILLLKAVIFFLHKAELTSGVARLARKSLPKVTLWFPTLMKKARLEMDRYVHRWEESAAGILEKSRSLSINNLD